VDSFRKCHQKKGRLRELKKGFKKRDGLRSSRREERLYWSVIKYSCHQKALNRPRGRRKGGKRNPLMGSQKIQGDGDLHSWHMDV